MMTGRSAKVLNADRRRNTSTSINLKFERSKNQFYVLLKATAFGSRESCAWTSRKIDCLLAKPACPHC